jgi:predicted phosphoribosyltransferase
MGEVIMKYEHILEIEELRDRTGLFADRYEAGQVLSRLVMPLGLQHPLVLSIPAGGVPVAVPLAEALNCHLDVAIVSKITLPWNTEAGYGAVAFDGSYLLNEAMIRAVGLDEADVAKGLEKTRAKVVRRVAALRKGRPMADMTECEVIVVDDGLASGFTMYAAVAALRRAGVGELIVAVPTGYENSVQSLSEKVDMVCCANIRSGASFAVASAYQYWDDVSEDEAEQILLESSKAQYPLWEGDT